MKSKTGKEGRVDGSRGVRQKETMKPATEMESRSRETWVQLWSQEFKTDPDHGLNGPTNIMRLRTQTGFV